MRLRGRVLLKFFPIIVVGMSLLVLSFNKQDKQDRNKIGDKASNFSFMLGGKKQTLDGLLREGKGNVLVLFHSPDCEDCAKAKKQLAKNKRIRRGLEEEKLRVLAVAVETDSLKWDSTCAKLPSEWLNAYCENCEEIIKDYIWTVPTLFLIDENGVVKNRDFKANEKIDYY